MEVIGQLHFWGKAPRYPLDKSLDGFQTWTERGDKGKVPSLN